MRARTASWHGVTLLLIALGIGAGSGCGGGGSSSTPPPTSPSPPPPSGGGSSTATIRITSSGVDPKEVTIAVGGRVTFVNNSTTAREPSSDPHPTHTICPEINVGRLDPGQMRETGVINRAVRCGFHDHNDPTNASLTGTIIVQ
ncbi:MAG: hypothetical protein KJ061_01290 [Vicinamibacteraceae bacterium]|nr:hypothetical protein [Vicinamibacteraceae bacterium]